MRTVVMLFMVAMAAMLGGCSGERSFPMVPGRLARLTAAQVSTSGGQRMATREWAVVAHRAAMDKLPADGRAALLTDDFHMEARGAAGAAPRIINVWEHFQIDPGQVDSLWGNYCGIMETSEVSSPPAVLKDGHIDRGAWAGFHDIDAPGEGAILFARLGVPEKQYEIPGSFVIVTHGLFGSLDGFDMENHVQALRRAGHHVLALEMRGHGETFYRHPEYAITFGILESADLLHVAEWLKQTQGATRVGLVSFSLTAYEALLTAWLDGSAPVHEFDGDPVLRELPKRGEAGPAFNGGMFMVSPVMGVVALGDRFERRRFFLEAPVKARFQERVALRLEGYHEPPGFGIWALAESELRRAGYMKEHPLPEVRDSFLRFIDLSRENWAVGKRRLENVRTPVLVLAAANDPLAMAQDVAEMFGRVENPNIGVVMLRGGGHMGFSALSADYYYSMMVNFFDPRTAPRGIVK